MSDQTERLRALLDERGVEWRERVWGCNSVTTFWHARGVRWHYRENRFGELRLHADGLAPEQAIAATLGAKVTGETSDGFHTFNELYHHRAVLFSVIVRDHNELAWKSKLHYDGTMYDGMFIVGIETPHGQATYHYDIDPYWDMFDCRELGRAPEWDGHTPSDAIERIATLGSCNCSNNCTNGERTGTCHNIHEPPEDTTFWPAPHFKCSECGATHVSMGYVYYCPNCGKRVVDE